MKTYVSLYDIITITHDLCKKNGHRRNKVRKIIFLIYF